jgi:hypothetical protein
VGWAQKLEAGNIYPTAACLDLSTHHSRLTNERGIRDGSRGFLDTVMQMMEIGFKELTARLMTGGSRRGGVECFSGTLSILRARCTSKAAYFRLVLALLRLYFGCDLRVSSPQIRKLCTSVTSNLNLASHLTALAQIPPIEPRTIQRIESTGVSRGQVSIELTLVDRLWHTSILKRGSELKKA